MKNFDLAEMGLSEMTHSQMETVVGGSDFSRRVGEFFGWCAGCATNAAEMLGNMCKSWVEGEVMKKVIGH